MHKFQVGVIGYGLIGKRRAEIAASDPSCELRCVADIQKPKFTPLLERNRTRWEKDWRRVTRDPKVDLLIVSTPNSFLAPIACDALRQGKHVLMEKPMGRNLKDAIQIYQASRKSSGKLKIGFNHRYHPAIQKARRLLQNGAIGKPINLRAQYGHGGREGYEKEWRGNAKMAGGGELTDQGIHLIDLIQWFCGQPSEAAAMLQTAYWPVRPIEDNGFALLKYRSGLIASFHSSWTQWKNLFRFEIFGTKGFLTIEGLSGSYGHPTLTVGLKRKEGSVPEIVKEKFKDEDLTWKKEWEYFILAISHRKKYWGAPEEGVAVMRTLDALYRSHRYRTIVEMK
ncbi:MAG: Gfo/Idh/MocA family oxidoreductase [Elusimicrobia bacterium]|nr:Gfo/Idh/MocA family oxidoreductase [Elusimicrobiota bacterium]